MLTGDERAFRAFFDTYFPRVYRFALPRLGGSIERFMVTWWHVLEQ
jgi:RNA polymerase sigma-70 factor (ECF subfamily)